MLTENRELKVLDFGLAHLQVGADVSTLTELGTVVGTMSYMAPEQILGKPVGAHSDLFSFGSVIYEIATGKQPFRAERLPEMIRSIVEEDPPPIDTIKPELGGGLAEVIEHCMRKIPAERPSGAGAIAASLKAL